MYRTSSFNIDVRLLFQYAHVWCIYIYMYMYMYMYHIIILCLRPDEGHEPKLKKLNNKILFSEVHFSIMASTLTILKTEAVMI
jgi:hypothetical protein